ncbi:lasso RiPP family leader peptide-containing protein [Streptomyces cyaneofuscatus]|uniref:lasso RiPP family leader peptide-containing protein n=1 Tax=Streptomyces cyaneofuscatus TaxID=66883 RepID=UPI00341829A8
MKPTEIQTAQPLAIAEVLVTPEVFTTPEVTDLGPVREVTLGSGGFNNPDSTMYFQG